MVAKISSGKSLFGALEYNKIKVDANEAQVIVSNNMFDMVGRPFSHRLCQAAFEPYLAANKKTESPIIHISLNPSPDDKLSDEQFAEIAEEYMQRMGYGNQPYIVFKHSDIDRVHCHIIVSVRVDETGKKIDSNFEKKRSMAICRELETEFNLHPATKKANR